MKRLVRSASGARHLRWGREVLSTMEAHQEVNYLLTREQKKVLGTEAAGLRRALEGLEQAVTPYREHLERAHVDIRARQRVGDYLCDVAQRQADGAMRPHRQDLDAAMPGGFARIFSGLALSRVLEQGYDRTATLASAAATVLRSMPPSIPGTEPVAEALERASTLLAGFNKVRNEEIEPQRVPLKAAVERGIFTLRETLEQQDGRLRTHFPQSFIESLYPELDRGATAVTDEEDEDDDTSRPAPVPTPSGGGNPTV